MQNVMKYGLLFIFCLLLFSVSLTCIHKNRWIGMLLAKERPKVKEAKSPIENSTVVNTHITNKPNILSTCSLTYAQTLRPPHKPTVRETSKQQKEGKSENVPNTYL